MKKTKKHQMSKRISCIELQIFTYLGSKKMHIEEIKKGFFGIASFETIKEIIETSPIFSLNDNLVNVNDIEHRANITYDFKPDKEDDCELFISQKKGEIGNHTLNDILMESGYILPIEVRVAGICNWELKITRIEVTSDYQHERVIDEPLISESGSYDKLHLTYEI